VSSKVDIVKSDLEENLDLHTVRVHALHTLAYTTNSCCLEAFALDPLLNQAFLLAEEFLLSFDYRSNPLESSERV
jgi:hypothetical protein